MRDRIAQLESENAALRATLDCISCAEQRHRLVDDTLVRETNGIAARCACGWASVGHFSSMAASVAFRTHVEDMERLSYAQVRS